MSNAYDPNFTDDTNDADLMPYDDTFSEEDYVAELVAEGYSEEEAKRMAGEYDYSDEEDEYGYGDDSLDRDVPDFVDGGDFE
jgi:hypothetical protein